MHFSLHSGVAAAVQKRASMDRRRLEDAHLKFAVLQVVSWYPEALTLGEVDLSSSVSECLGRVTGTYYSQFSKKYAGKRLPEICKLHEFHSLVQ